MHIASSRTSKLRPVSSPSTHVRAFSTHAAHSQRPGRLLTSSLLSHQKATKHSGAFRSIQTAAYSGYAQPVTQVSQPAAYSGYAQPLTQVSQPAAYSAYAQPVIQVPHPVPQTQHQSHSLWRNDYDQHYIHGKRLGAGSFGNVYLGIHRHSGYEVAVKIMPKKRNNLSREKTIGRITKEVSILEALQDCANVVRLYGCFDGGEEVEVVMEHCGGGDLQRTLDSEGLFSEYDLAVVAYEVLRIIKACHDKCILHGDVKPANFVLTHARTHYHCLQYGVGCLKAIDFGCSQFLPGGERLGRRVGTPAYMAPEVFHRDAGMEADMWSLGVMLFQLYTGRFPFWEGQIQPGAAGVEEVMEAVMQRPMLIEGTTFPTLTAQGQDFIRQCLRRDLNTRITADRALQHPWFYNALCQSNIVPMGS